MEGVLSLWRNVDRGDKEWAETERNSSDDRRLPFNRITLG